MPTEQHDIKVYITNLHIRKVLSDMVHITRGNLEYDIDVFTKIMSDKN